LFALSINANTLAFRLWTYEADRSIPASLSFQSPGLTAAIFFCYRDPNQQYHQQTRQLKLPIQTLSRAPQLAPTKNYSTTKLLFASGIITWNDFFAPAKQFFGGPPATFFILSALLCFNKYAANGTLATNENSCLELQSCLSK